MKTTIQSLLSRTGLCFFIFVSGFAFAPVVMATQLETLVAFDGTNESGPEGSLIADAKGNLYGTTSQGGILNLGTVFQLQPPTKSHPAWTLTNLHSFTGLNQGRSYWNGPEGGNPISGLLRDAKGNLYGTTRDVGVNNLGTVFQLQPPTKSQQDWTLTTLHSFAGATEGSYPESSLLRDGKGNLYGTTRDGGSGSAGTVFQLQPPTKSQPVWTLITLHSFAGGTTEGSSPYSSLIRDGKGNLYGTTYAGGSGSAGTVFKLKP